MKGERTVNEQSKEQLNRLIEVGAFQRADGFTVEFPDYSCRYEAATEATMTATVCKVDFPAFFARPRRMEKEDPIQTVAKQYIRETLHLSSELLIRLRNGSWSDAGIQRLASRHGITSTQWYAFAGAPLPKEGNGIQVPGDVVPFGVAFYYSPRRSMRQLIADLKYQKEIIFKMVNREGGVWDCWRLEVQQLTDARYGTFDVNNAKPLTVAVTFRCEVLEAPSYHE
jgi:hypothetical protein